MSQSAAVMPRAMVLNPSRDPSRFVLAAGPHLTGLSPHEDPPPPRV
jgi:hypothetical protein